MNDIRACALAVLLSLAFAGCQSTVFGDIAQGDADMTASADQGPSSGGDTSTPPGDTGDAGDPGARVITSPSSTWLGMNVDSDLPRNDITWQLNPFDTASAEKDANGYPVAGASGTSSTDIGFALPSGTYKISYKGSGTLTISGIATLQGDWQMDAASGERRGSLSLTGTYGSYGHFLTLAIANNGSATVTDIHIYLPGVDYDPPQTFTAQQSAALAPFRAFRFMGWMATNGSAVTDWTDRTPAGHFGDTAAGVPYEHIVELTNITGKDMWINIPEHATPAFIQSFAEFLLANLDMDRISAARAAQGVTAPFEIIIEDSNETWNTAFTAYATFLAAANADGGYDGTYNMAYGPDFMGESPDLMKVGRYHADRLVKIGNTFRSVFTGSSAHIAPVLAGWALGAAYNDVGLQFVQAKYGDPKNYFKYIAIAPYFGPANDDATGSLDGIFAACTANINSMASAFTDFANLAQQYGLQMSAYEGGQGMGGSTNLAVKHLAQFDKRMYDTYTSYYAFWQQHFGKSLFMHFVLAETPGTPDFNFQFGFWGALEGVMTDLDTCGKNIPTFTGSEPYQQAQKYCPKYQASVDAALK